jgi:hypothetical protein
LWELERSGGVTEAVVAVTTIPATTARLLRPVGLRTSCGPSVTCRWAGTSSPLVAHRLGKPSGVTPLPARSGDSSVSGLDLGWTGRGRDRKRPRWPGRRVDVRGVRSCRAVPRRTRRSSAAYHLVVLDERRSRLASLLAVDPSLDEAASSQHGSLRRCRSAAGGDRDRGPWRHPRRRSSSRCRIPVGRTTRNRAASHKLCGRSRRRAVRAGASRLISDLLECA